MKPGAELRTAVSHLDLLVAQKYRANGYVILEDVVGLADFQTETESHRQQAEKNRFSRIRGR